jgi:hypothetical protein
MTLTCNDYGNPTSAKCNYCNDRGACEEEMQVRMTKEEAPIIDVTPFLHSARFERMKVFGIGLLVGSVSVVIFQSAFGLPMAALVMAAVFGAGYVFGSDKMVKTPPAKKTPRRMKRNGW